MAKAKYIKLYIYTQGCISESAPMYFLTTSGNYMDIPINHCIFYTTGMGVPIKVTTLRVYLSDRKTSFYCPLCKTFAEAFIL